MSQYGDMKLLKNQKQVNLTQQSWKEINGPVLDFTQNLISHEIPSTLSKFQIGIEMEIWKEIRLSEPVREVWCLFEKYVIADLLKTQ